MKTPKQILANMEKEFSELHLKCIEETKKLGKASWNTHTLRCEALGKISASKERWKEELEFLEEHEKEEYRGCSFTLKVRKRIVELREVLK